MGLSIENTKYMIKELEKQLAEAQIKYPHSKYNYHPIPKWLNLFRKDLEQMELIKKEVKK